MTDKDYYSYRFSSDEEPSDELLCALMSKASAKARRAKAEADARFWEALHRETEAAKLRYEQELMQ